MNIVFKERRSFLFKFKTNPLLKTKYRFVGCYELAIFLFLLFEFFALTSEKYLGSWEKTFYLLNYKFGFISRAFVGSVFSLFTDYVTDDMIYISGIISFLVLIILISLLLGRLIRKSMPVMKPAIIIFAALFLSSPFSVKYLLGFHIGRFDTYWIIITLLALAFIKNRILKWFIPFLCAIAVAIHQGYMDTYMPALAIPLLYEIYKNSYSKKIIVIFSASCLIMIALFSAFQFFPHSIPFDNPIDFAGLLSTGADFKASAPQLYVEYYAPFREYWIEDITPLMKTFAIPLLSAYLLISLPLFIIFGFIWKNSFIASENRFQKFVFFLCAAAPSAFIPAALFGLDWDRWWAAFINTQFILIFYFINSKESIVVESVKRAGAFFEKHFFLFLLLIISFGFLTFSESVTNMFSFVRNSDEFMQHYVDYFNTHLFYPDKMDYWSIMGI
jgi:hypothetical protein